MTDVGTAGDQQTFRLNNERFDEPDILCHPSDVDGQVGGCNGLLEGLSRGIMASTSFKYYSDYPDTDYPVNVYTPTE